MGARDEASRERPRTRGTKIGQGLTLLLAVALTATGVTVIWSLAEAVRVPLTATGTHVTAFVISGPAGMHFCLPGEGCPPSEVRLQEPMVRTAGEGFVADGIPSRLLTPVAVSALAQDRKVAHVAPYLAFRFWDWQGTDTITVGGYNPEDISVVSTTVVGPEEVRSGRLLQPGDRGVALASSAWAAWRGVSVGDGVRLGGRDFQVVGLVQTEARLTRAQVYLPLEELQALVNEAVTAPVDQPTNMVLVEAKDPGGARRLAARLTSWGLSPSLDPNWETAWQALQWVQAGRWLLLGLVGATGLLWLLTAQAGYVGRRRRDLPEELSRGPKLQAAVNSILAECLGLSLVGLVLGAAVAAGLVYLVPWASLVKMQTALAPVVPWPVLGIVVGGVLVGGLFFGALPAALAAQRGSGQAAAPPPPEPAETPE